MTPEGVGFGTPYANIHGSELVPKRKSPVWPSGSAIKVIANAHKPLESQ